MNADAGERDLPLISVVTPTLNHAARLPRMLASVHQQGYPHLEHIVIDGGSSDGSQQILESWSTRLSYWVSEPDRGQSHAINKGMARARGEILAYLNADDSYAPDSLWAVGRFFRSHPDVDLLHGDCAIVGEDGALRCVHRADIARYDDIVDVWRVWFKQRQFVQPEVFWRARAAPGPFDESLNYVMDFDYWLRMLRAGARVAGTARTLAHFELSGTQKSSQWRAVEAELFEVLARELWDPRAPLRRRHALQGDWYYHSTFLPAVRASEAAGESRLQRYRRLLGLVVRHPQLLRSKLLRKRLGATAPARALTRG